MWTQSAVSAAALLAALALSAPARSAPGPAPKPRLPGNALPVPLVRQATSYSCGAASVLSVLFYWKAYDGNETELYPQLNTTEQDGTDPLNMTKVLHETYGLESKFLENLSVDDLRKYFAQGYTVI